MVLLVAKWVKLCAHIVTTKKRKYGNALRREGSPIPGVDLIEIDALSGIG